jgi:hypothetical protein
LLAPDCQFLHPSGSVVSKEEIMPTLSDVLARYGVSNRTISSIEPHRDDHGLWRIKFGGPGDPAIMMDIGGAAKLAVELRPIDEDWAKKLEAAVSTARRYAGLPPSCP